MNLIVNNHSVLEIIAVTFLVSCILVPLAKNCAKHVGALDMPNERKIHKNAMPRMGGLAIFGGFLIGYILYGDITTQMISILIGAFIIFLLGIFDDIKPIKAKYKFLIQIIAAIIVVLYGQIYFTEITLLGLKLEFNIYISYFL